MGKSVPALFGISNLAPRLHLAASLATKSSAESTYYGTWSPGPASSGEQWNRGRPSARPDGRGVRRSTWVVAYLEIFLRPE
jgi:hypothetical protein